MKKSEIIDSIIKEQQKIINDLIKAKEIYRKSSDIDEEDVIYTEDLSHQTLSKEMQLNIEVKIERQQNMVSALEKFKNEPKTEVEEGALIETDSIYLFIGGVAHPLEVNGKKVFTVSNKAPIMEKLVGKKVGDSFQVGNEQHVIKHIG